MKEKFNLVLPRQKPKTIGDILNWHKKLFEDCLYFELKSRSLKSSISKLNTEINKVKEYLKKEDYEAAAKLQLIKLNEILNEFKEELSVIKIAIRSLHKTNEEIIGSIVKHTLGKEKTKELYEKHKNISGNILHGDGWMIEYFAAKEYWDKGKAAFIAFGTFLDPAGFDLIVIPNKLDEKINFNVDYLSLNGAE